MLSMQASNGLHKRETLWVSKACLSRRIWKRVGKWSRPRAVQCRAEVASTLCRLAQAALVSLCNYPRRSKKRCPALQAAPCRLVTRLFWILQPGIGTQGASTHRHHQTAALKAKPRLQAAEKRQNAFFSCARAASSSAVNCARCRAKDGNRGRGRRGTYSRGRGRFARGGRGQAVVRASRHIDGFRILPSAADKPPPACDDLHFASGLTFLSNGGFSFEPPQRMGNASKNAAPEPLRDAARRGWHSGRGRSGRSCRPRSYRENSEAADPDLRARSPTRGRRSHRGAARRGRSRGRGYPEGKPVEVSVK